VKRTDYLFREAPFLAGFARPDFLGFLEPLDTFPALPDEIFFTSSGEKNLRVPSFFPTFILHEYCRTVETDNPVRRATSSTVSFIYASSPSL
jgi:hypothetical protein